MLRSVGRELHVKPMKAKSSLTMWLDLNGAFVSHRFTPAIIANPQTGTDVGRGGGDSVGSILLSIHFGEEEVANNHVGIVLKLQK